jgi:hypothetical protein
VTSSSIFCIGRRFSSHSRLPRPASRPEYNRRRSAPSPRLTFRSGLLPLQMPPTFRDREFPLSRQSATIVTARRPDRSPKGRLAAPKPIGRDSAVVRPHSAAPEDRGAAEVGALCNDSEARHSAVLRRAMPLAGFQLKILRSAAADPDFGLGLRLPGFKLFGLIRRRGKPNSKTTGSGQSTQGVCARRTLRNPRAASSDTIVAWTSRRENLPVRSQ